MDIAYEALDFLNFDLQDVGAFKGIVVGKELVKGVPYPYDAYTRLMALTQAPFNRTSQLVKEWLSMRLKSCEFKEVNGVHVYTSPVPENQPGRFQVQVEKDKNRVVCHVVRSAEWHGNVFVKAQLGGKGQNESLEVLIGSMHRWAGQWLPVEEVRKEIAYYFSHLAASPQPPHGFAGFVAYGNRSVIVRIGLRTISDSVEATVDVENYRMPK